MGALFFKVRYGADHSKNSLYRGFFFYQIYIENIHFLQTLNNCMEIVILYGCRQIKKKGAHVYEG